MGAGALYLMGAGARSGRGGGARSGRGAGARSGRGGGARSGRGGRSGGEGVGGLWTGGGVPPCPIPRGIALKFFQKSSPICPNTAGCQPSPAVNVPKHAIIALSYFSFRA